MRILKRGICKSSYSQLIDGKVIWKTETLIQRALSKGKKKEYKPPGIKSHSLTHSAGIMIVYTNSTPNKELDETITFKLEGMKITNFGSSKVNIKCGPGETKHIQIDKLSSGYSYSSSSSYYVNDYKPPVT